MSEAFKVGKENVPRIEYGDKFTGKTLELQVRSYLALKDMAAEKNITSWASSASRIW